MRVWSSGLIGGKSRPVAFKKEGNNVVDWELTADPYPTWKKLEEMVDKGKVRNIGISKCVTGISVEITISRYDAFVPASILAGRILLRSVPHALFTN